jgi:hypothetical protein
MPTLPRWWSLLLHKLATSGLRDQLRIEAGEPRCRPIVEGSLPAAIQCASVFRFSDWINGWGPMFRSISRIAFGFAALADTPAIPRMAP